MRCSLQRLLVDSIRMTGETTLNLQFSSPKTAFFLRMACEDFSVRVLKLAATPDPSPLPLDE